MNKLQDRQWAPFKISELFEIKTGANISKIFLDFRGQIPRITASATNNGIDSFTKETSVRNFRTNENCVSISFLGTCFYQPIKASYDMKIHSIKIKDRKLNKYIGLFIAFVCNREFQKFSYGNQLSSTDLPKQQILLPITVDGQPDWQFMEDYMREKEQQILKPITEKLCKRLIISDISGGGNSANSHWKEYVFGEAFNIVSTKSGIDKIKLNKEEGSIPYVTRTDVNNGIDTFVGCQEEKFKVDSGNVITIGLDTQSVFYQPKPFYTGQNIQVVSHPMLDRYNASFIIVSIKKLVERFSWGSYGATLSRLRRSRIFLPANTKGEIDFAFMSSYMQKVEKDILGFTLQHFKNKLNVKKCETGG